MKKNYTIISEKIIVNLLLLMKLVQITEKKITNVFQKFILHSLSRLRPLLPFDDKITQKISAFDPDCNTTSSDLETLGELYDNIIVDKEYGILLNELKDWEYERSKMTKLSLRKETRILITKVNGQCRKNFSR